MILWVLVPSSVYLGVLGYIALRAYRSNLEAPNDYLTAGSQLGPFLGTLTFGATLLSTFTFMGMPDFFRVHGVAAWIFFGLTDIALAFVTLWFGLYFRKYIRQGGFRSVALLLKSAYGSSFGMWVYLIGIFIFLVPYATIQIRALSLFMSEVAPLSMSSTMWSVSILSILLLYSVVGGLKAIIYSDAVQGVLLLLALWIVALTSYRFLGSDLAVVFEQVYAADPTLLCAPGPEGVLTVQFLLSAFLAIICMPISQPQLTVRIAILKDDRALRWLAIAMGSFVFAAIFPTMIIGNYGSVFLSDASSVDFWNAVIVENHTPIVAGLTTLGVIAAAMSTADSQIFALGTEFGSVRTEKKHPSAVGLTTIFFALCVFALSTVTTTELVLLARLSFVGTALLTPMIVLPIALAHKGVSVKRLGGSGRHLGALLPFVVSSALLAFILILLEALPASVLGINLDLILLIIVSSIATAIYLGTKADDS